MSRTSNLETFSYYKVASKDLNYTNTEPKNPIIATRKKDVIDILYQTYPLRPALPYIRIEEQHSFILQGMEADRKRPGFQSFWYLTMRGEKGLCWEMRNGEKAGLDPAFCADAILEAAEAERRKDLEAAVADMAIWGRAEQTRQALFGELPAMAVPLEIWKLNWTLD
ncbi:hypothetical protein D5086_008089 [Populus alba]|uniref:Uncharacterized protein n=1 Tax=Populus alba TaxID=43335 RepID=A0ACC4CFS8_POPAL